MRIINSMIKKIILLVSLSLFLIGCETTTRAKIVKVPIIICPVPEYIAEPHLKIDDLEIVDMKDFEKIAKAYATTIVKQSAYIEKLKAQLQVYRDTRGEQK